jgi:putative peptidoglycan lipid II flippase
MGGMLWLAARFALAQSATIHGETIHGFAQAAALLALIAAGIAVYGLLLGFFGVTSWRETLNAIRQPSRSDLRR